MKKVSPPPGFGPKTTKLPIGIVTKLPVELGDTYTILGEGTYGQVRRYETRKGPIAVKISKSIKEGGINPSLLREAAALSAIGRHPNVVGLLDMYVTDKESAIVIPLADTSLLDDIESDGALGERESKLITIQLIRGLMYIHSKDLIHSDMKSGNVLLVEGEGCPKCEDEKCPLRAIISDLGGARTSRCWELEQPQYSGTPVELPPEYILGDVYTTKGDIWALGCTIAEMMTGTPPFDPEVGEEGEEADVTINDVLAKIFVVLGTANEGRWPGVTALPKWGKRWEYEEMYEPGIEPMERYGKISADAKRFLNRILVLDPNKRATLHELLLDPWLDSIRDMAEEPCLKVEEPKSLSCPVIIQDRQADDKVVFPYDVEAKILLYGWLEGLRSNFKSTDRIKGLAIYIFERSNVLRELSGNPNLDKIQLYAASSYVIASLLLDQHRISMKELETLSNFVIKKEEFNEATRVILGLVGPDLYIATSYDVLYSLTDSYADVTRDAALTLHELSYYTVASMFAPVVVALACVLLGAGFSGEEFVHDNKVNEVGRDNVDSVIRLLGEELSVVLKGEEERYEIIDSAKRGAYDTRSILTTTPLIGKYYTWVEKRVPSRRLSF